jgi:GMP synthase-like glutamine amidotransferase
MKKLLVIEHDPAGPVGTIGAYLESLGCELTVLTITNGSSISDVVYSDPEHFDGVVGLGSFEAVYDTDAIGSWVGREIDFLRRVHEADIAYLGVCFGAQAMAAALGGTVQLAPELEIGWTHFTSLDPSVPAGPWLTWHHDCFTVPPGATELARSPVCSQAYMLRRTLCIQTHPEATRDTVAGWIDACGVDYVEEHGIDTDEILGGFATHGVAAQANMRHLVDSWLAL